MALDEDAKKKSRQIVESMLKYDIELYQIDTAGCEDVGSMSKNTFGERYNVAQSIDYDTFFLLDEIRRVNV